MEMKQKKNSSLLGSDVFSYFGLGCRSVSKIYVPDGYDITRLINSWSRLLIG